MVTRIIKQGVDKSTRKLSQYMNLYECPAIISYNIHGIDGHQNN